MSRKVLFIINPAAGKDITRRWLHFSQRFRGARLKFDERTTVRAGEATELAARHAPNYDVICAVGGDGTVFEVVNGLCAAGPRRPNVGIVPFGTGNDTARVFGIKDEEDAWLALAEGSAQATDLIRVECSSDGKTAVRYAASFASVGITSDVLKQATPGLKRILGRRLAYMAAVLLALRNHAPKKMTITCDGVERNGEFLLACASNTETFGGGIRVAPGTKVDDGLLDINLIDAVNRWEAVRHLGRLRQGRHITHPRVQYKPAREMIIRTEQPIEVAADGDLIGWTPARFSVAPEEIGVLRPGTRELSQRVATRTQLTT